VLFLLIVLDTIYGDQSLWLSTLGAMAMGLFVFFGIIGMILGIMYGTGHLRMRCPFCKESGPLESSKREGIWMECPRCGIIRGSGFLGLVLEAERPIDES